MNSQISGIHYQFDNDKAVFICKSMDTGEDIIAADDQKVHNCTTLFMMYVVREVLHAVNFFIHAYNLD